MAEKRMHRNCVHFDCGICCLGEGDECVKKPGCGYVPMPTNYEAIAMAAWQYLAELEAAEVASRASAKRAAATRRALFDANPEGTDPVLGRKCHAEDALFKIYINRANGLAMEIDRLRDLIGDPR